MGASKKVNPSYPDKGESSKSLESLLKSKELYEQSGETEKLGLILLEIAAIYLEKGIMSKFIENSTRAKEIFEKIGKSFP